MRLIFMIKKIPRTHMAKYLLAHADLHKTKQGLVEVSAAAL